MKVSLYYSRDKIKKITNEYQIKTELSKYVAEAFNCLYDVSYDDVMVASAKISNDIDAVMVIDAQLNDAMMKNAHKSLSELEARVLAILQKDQNSVLDFKVRIKVEKNHTPIKMVNESMERGEVSMDNTNESNGDSELDYAKRAEAYVAVTPSYSFNRVILPVSVIEKIEEALYILQYEKKVFDEWGLYEIQPRPSSSLSFFGPSGTGKTMAAEAVAQKLGKKILKVSYADVESKYHGEGPKMVKAIFMAAEKQDAVLFFDEADSLLSKRLTNVSQGSEQAINSMRSQLLICLEEFHGIVIFATNLVINYDQAFLTRLISVEFITPDVQTRKNIWDVHLKPVEDGQKHKLNIPLDSDVDSMMLAESYDFVGREIRNAVISACIKAAMDGKNIVSQNDFIIACEKIVSEKASLSSAKDHTLPVQNNDVLKNLVLDKIKEGAGQSVSTTTE